METGIDSLYDELETLPLGGDPRLIIGKINEILYQKSEDEVKRVFRPIILRLVLEIIRDHFRKINRPVNRSDVIKTREMLGKLKDVDFSKFKND